MSVQQYDKQNKLLKLIAGGTLWADCPVGTINAYGGITAPDGWLLCQGQALSRTDYADLFAVIGTSFGSGDGSTTFNAPDFRGEFLRGAGTNSHSGQGNGGSVGQHQDATQVSGVYGNTDNNRVYSANTIGSDYDGVVTGQKEIYSESGGMQPSSGLYMLVRPTNTSVNFIIKAKQTPLPADLEAAIQDIDFLTWGDNS